jgi:hypothetical protein
MRPIFPDRSSRNKMSTVRSMSTLRPGRRRRRVTPRFFLQIPVIKSSQILETSIDTPFRTSLGLGYGGGGTVSHSFRATSAKPILRGEKTVARIQDRMIRAAKLDVQLYEEVEADRGAMREAMTVVVLSAVAAGIGNIANGGLLGIIGGTIGALVGWYIWAFLTYFIGTRLLPEPDTKADHAELLRTIGFSSAPGLIRVFGIIPGLTPFVFAVAGGWMLVAMVIAVRQALDYKSTWRALGVCVIGWVIQALVLVAAVSIFGSP